MQLETNSRSITHISVYARSNGESSPGHSVTFRVAPWALLFGTGFVLTACAAPAIIVEPTAFSGERYSEMSCDRLDREQARLTQALSTASDQQETIRLERAQELGLELAIGVPLAAAAIYAGADVADLDLKPEALGYYDDLSSEIARLKGELKAAKRTMARKKCRAVPASTSAS